MQEMIKNRIEKTFAKWLMALICAGMVGVAEATNYDYVWTDTFEDATTYTQNISGGSIANAAMAVTTTSFGSAVQGASQKERTLLDGVTTSKMFYVGTSGNSSTAKNNVLTIPDDAYNGLTDYQVSFDYFLSTGYDAGNNCWSGLAIVDEDVNTLATIYADCTSSSNYDTYDVGNICLGDDTSRSLVSGFAVPSRGKGGDGTSFQNYWLHVTLTCNSGVLSLRVQRADDTDVLAETVIASSTSSKIKYLYMRVASHRLTAYGGLDDVLVGKPVTTAHTFTWTGAGTDSNLKTPKNWSVDGAEQTETSYYPQELDTAIVPEENTASISLSQGDTIAKLTVNGTVTLKPTNEGSVLTLGDLDGTGTLNLDVSSMTTWTPPVEVLATTKDNLFSSTAVIIATANVPDSYAVLIDKTTNTKKLYVTLVASTTYIWTGLGGNDDTKWSTLTNWKRADDQTVTAYPASSDLVLFPLSSKQAVVTMDGTTSSDGKVQVFYIAGLTVCGDVKIVGSSTAVRLHPVTVSGSGKISFLGAGFHTGTGSSLTINNDIEILPAESGNAWSIVSPFTIRGSGKGHALKGALTGSGFLQLNGDGNSSEFYNLYGVSGFSGKLEVGETTKLETSDALNLGAATVQINSGDELDVDSSNEGTVLKIGALSGAGALKQLTSHAMTLEVGSVASATFAGTIRHNDGVDNWTIKKVGATTTQALSSLAMTNSVDLAEGVLDVPVGVCFDAFQKESGKLKFTIPNNEDWTSGTNCVLFTCASGLDAGTAVDYVTLDTSAFSKRQVATYNNETANTLLVTLEEAKYTWNGSDYGDWSNANNWLLGGEATDTAPSSSSEYAVALDANDKIGVTLGQTFGSVTAESGAQLLVMFTAADQTFTKPTDFAGSVVAAGPFTMDESGKSTRVASTFTWATSSNGNWADTSSWKVGDYATAVLPGSDDTVSFASGLDVTVTLANSYTVAKVSAAGTVTFSSESKTLTCDEIEGSGTVKMSATYGKVSTTLDNFTGTLDLTAAPTGADPRAFTATEPVKGNASMKLVLGENITYQMSYNKSTTTDEYYFGEVTGKGILEGGNDTVVVGSLNSPFTFGACLYRNVASSNPIILKKVGSSAMTFEGSGNTRNNDSVVEIAEGSVTFATNFNFAAFGTVKFDDENVTAGFNVSRAALLQASTYTLFKYSGDVMPATTQFTINEGKNTDWYTGAFSGTSYILTPNLDALAWKWAGTKTNVTDAEAFTDGVNTHTFAAGDAIVFDDTGCSGDSTTVVFPSDIAPIRVDVKPSSSKTYILKGDGKVLDTSSPYVNLASGTLELDSDVLADIAFNNVSGSKVVVNPGADNTVNFGALTGSPAVTVQSGTLNLNEKLPGGSAFSVADGAVIIVNHSTQDFNGSLSGYSFNGAGTVHIAAECSFAEQRNTSPFAYLSGSIVFHENTTLKLPRDGRLNLFGNSNANLTLGGVTVSSYSNSQQSEYLPISPSAVTVAGENTLNATRNQLQFDGKVSGTGTLNCAGKGVLFADDDSGFYGIINFNASSSSGYTAANAGFTKAAAAPANGTVNVNTNITLSATDTTTDEPAAFGTLNMSDKGFINVTASGAYIQIGAGKINGGFTGNAPTITKVGTDALTFTATTPFPAGTTLAVTAGAEEIILQNTSLVAGTDYVLGTDTLSKTGDDNYTHLYNKNTVRMSTDSSAVELSGVTTEAEAEAAAENYLITLDSTRAAAGLKKEYYKAKVVEPATEGGNYSVEPGLNEEVVDPISASTTMTGNTSGVTVTPGNVKKGLYYKLAASTTNSDTAFAADTTTSFEPATGDSISLSNSKTDSTTKVMYYKVLVSDTAQ